MNQKLLAVYGIKFNPFSPELPTEALRLTSQVDSFCWRVEHSLVREGGFALISGDPGTGKSVVLRLLAERLARVRELTVGALTHSSSRLSDFYRSCRYRHDLYYSESRIIPHPACKCEFWGVSEVTCRNN